MFSKLEGRSPIYYRTKYELKPATAARVHAAKKFKRSVYSKERKNADEMHHRELPLRSVQ